MSGPVLVTGAAGFVGRHLVAALVADGVEVVGWRRPDVADPQPLPTGAAFLDVDILDRDAVRASIAALRPSAIYHLAGFANVAQAWRQIREAFEVNVLGTHHVLDALRASDQRPRVLVSLSAAVYRAQPRALVEDDVLEPLHPYAASKLAQEMVATAAFRDDGIPTLLARAFNHAGRGQAPGFILPDIAQQIARIEVERAEPVLSLGNVDAERDLSDVRDVVSAYRALMAHGRPGVAYNVCAGRAFSVRWLVERIAAHAGLPIRIEQDPAKLRPNDNPLVVGSHARLSADTGWTPAVPIETTLADVLDDWRARAGAARS